MAHILIIDDDDQLRSMIRLMLEGTGHTLQDAPDGKAGLALLQKQPADLIITDILMPEKDGIEIIRALKRDRPEVKIIAISGGGDTGRIDFLPLAQDFGADLALHKPFSQDRLLQAVAHLLDKNHTS